jgi:D-sedoheptulose 7-phosphate isomerase
MTTMRTHIEDYLTESKRLLDSLERDPLQRAAELLLRAHARGARVWTMGNGGSATTASHLACDLGKYVIPKGTRPFDVRCLTDNVGLYTAWANDAERDLVFVHQMQGLLRAGDVAVIISVHGGDGFSKDLLRAAEYARGNGASVIAWVGFDGGPLRAIADCPILIPAQSTPHTEGLHLVVHHLLMHLVRESLASQTVAAVGA